MTKTYLDKDGLRRYSDKLQTLLDKKANKAEVKSMLATLAEKVRNNEITIESHTRSIADNATNIETNTNDITDLKNLTASHSTQISNNTVDIDDLQALTERHTGNIEILIQKDMQKETDITNLQTRDIQHDNAIQALNQNKADKTELNEYILYSDIINNENIRALFRDIMQGNNER